MTPYLATPFEDPPKSENQARLAELFLRTTLSASSAVHHLKNHTTPPAARLLTGGHECGPDTSPQSSAPPFAFLQHEETGLTQRRPLRTLWTFHNSSCCPRSHNQRQALHRRLHHTVAKVQLTWLKTMSASMTTETSCSSTATEPRRC